MNPARSSSLVLALLVASAATVACQAQAVDASESGAGAFTAIDDKAVLDLPFYFAVPEDSLSEMTSAERQHPFLTGWNPARDDKGDFLTNVGLRTITVPDTGNTASSRQLVGEKLGAAGVLKEGDVVLTFRPKLANTLPYAHIQMGTTHAGIVRLTANGAAHTVNQPLDSVHNAPKGKPFQSEHYLGVDAFHIIRPRGLTPTRLENLDAWLGRAESLINLPGRPGFNDNYLIPAVAGIAKNPASPTQTEVAVLSTAIGKGLIAGNIRGVLNALAGGRFDLNPAADAEQQLFCSELVYHLLSLSNCTEADITASGDAPAACAQEAQPFPLLNLVGAQGPAGLGEGPLLTINEAGLGKSFADIVFATGDAKSKELSSGHLAANAILSGQVAFPSKDASAPKVKVDVISALRSAYESRTDNVSAPVTGPLQAINSQMAANYSPTAFLINTLRKSQERQFDYVATVVFAKDQKTLDTAKALSAQPIPHTEGSK